jgi:hypothetical protein
VYTERVARIVKADQEVGVYNDSYTFELAAPGEAASNTPAGHGLRAVRALRAEAAAAKLGQGRRRRKSKKSKYRSRKTRRTRR